MGQQYASEFKESIVKRMLFPHNEYIPTLSRETGIPVDTLYTWRVKYRSRSMGTALSKDRETSSLVPEEKLAAIFETMASMRLNWASIVVKRASTRNRSRSGKKRF